MKANAEASRSEKSMFEFIEFKFKTTVEVVKLLFVVMGPSLILSNDLYKLMLNLGQNGVEPFYKALGDAECLRILGATYLCYLTCAQTTLLTFLQMLTVTLSNLATFLVAKTMLPIQESRHTIYLDVACCNLLLFAYCRSYTAVF